MIKMTFTLLYTVYSYQIVPVFKINIHNLYSIISNSIIIIYAALNCSIQ